MKSFSWLAALGLSTALVTEAKTYLAYIGTYTGAQSQSKGIYAFRFDTATGVIEELGLVAETPNPTFLALHPNGRFLYAANEIADFKGAKSGSISAYQIDRTSGKLSLLGAAATTGDGPCHLNVDAAGHLLAFANYGGGSVGSMTIAADGRLGDPGTFSSTEVPASTPPGKRNRTPTPLISRRTIVSYSPATSARMKSGGIGSIPTGDWWPPRN